MKKILFLTPQLPFPPYGGGLIKSWKIVEFLSKNYKLGLACFLKGEDRNYLDNFKAKVNLYDFFFEDLDRKRNVSNFVKSLLKGIPLNVYRNYSLSFKREVIKRKDNYDLILVDHYVMFQYVPQDFKGRVILHEHNAEYVIWERLSKNKDYPFYIRLAARVESERIKNYEKRICNLSDKVLCVGPNDIENLAKLNIDRNKFELIMSVGDDELLNLPDLKFEKTEKALLFIGTLTWEANIDGLCWFINNCWKQLKVEFPNLKFYIVGKNPNERLINLVKNERDIVLTGFVKNLDEYYSKSRVFISPLRFGSGVEIKNINAMYRGIPIVTTSVGAEGLEVKDMIHMAINDSVDGFIEKIKILLTRKDVWYKLSRNSRNLAKEKYTWDKV
jgi:glycosyltransferase involved in cell wall biosynthesis